MALKLGQRVTVNPGVSNCKDAGSLRVFGEHGAPRGEFVGRKGEIVQIGSDFLKIKMRVGPSAQIVDDPQCGAATVPLGCEGMVLVDSQVVNGIRQGDNICGMREWFSEAELEVG